MSTALVYVLFIYILDFKEPHKKKANGLKSHELGGQFTSAQRKIALGGCLM